MNSAFDYNQETIKFYSNPLTVKKVIHTSYSTETEEYKNIRVNSAGFITSCNNDYSYIDEEETFTEHWDITIAYDLLLKFFFAKRYCCVCHTVFSSLYIDIPNLYTFYYQIKS